MHSAGDLQTGYALSLYGGSTRSIKNAVPGSTGVCGDTGGTQVGWNIKWVDVASGAAGGSELADHGDWAVSDPIVSDLVTTTARGMYKHNTTRSVWFYNFAAAKGTACSGVLPGQDDEAVSYHSTGAAPAPRAARCAIRGLVLRRHAQHRHQRVQLRPGQVVLPLGELPG